MTSRSSCHTAPVPTHGIDDNMLLRARMEKYAAVSQAERADYVRREKRLHDTVRKMLSEQRK